LRLPSEKIDQIRDATDIVEYIGGYVKLRKRGKNYQGLCPFHSEKTPSFSVSADRQMYHCFGCGVGGNVFTFVMERDKVSFIEAARMLAERAGIVLPESTPDQVEESNEQEQLYQILRTAAMFYHDSLTKTPEGKFALDYFHYRGFTDDTIRAFGLGYSPNSWEALLNHLKEKGFAVELMQKSGLVRRREDSGANDASERQSRGSHYDYFRGRAMFPIFSSSGRIIAFGARKIYETDPLGKYINSPETPIYSKSKVLYGISQSKEAIRELENAILVEGYADLISVFQAGVKNVVASSGTALTQEQIQLIRRYTTTITVVYDADSAGSQAALRGVDLVLQNDMDVRVAPLPEGEDPDSFVKKNGGDAFRELVGKAQSFVDFLAHTYEQQGSFSTPEGQAQAVRAIVRTISRMRDELKRNFYVKQLAEKYKLYESTLYREMEKHVNERRERSDHYTPSEVTSGPSAAEISPPVDVEIPVAERDLIHSMLEGGSEVVHLIFDRIQLEDFTHPQSRALAATIMDRIEHGGEVDPSQIINEIEEPLQRRLIAEMVFTKYHLSKGWDDGRTETERADPRRVASDAIAVMRRHSIEQLIEANQRTLKEASRRGDDVLPLLERHQQLLAEMKHLETKS
jgi:DNA primase